MNKFETDVRELSQKVLEVFDRSAIIFNRHDGYADMVARFYYKQCCHLRSMFKLGARYDLELICRCMIEGMAILSHAESSPDFVIRWQQQGDIENLRMLEAKRKIGSQISDEEDRDVNKRVAALTNLLKPERLKDIQQTNRKPRYDDFKPHKDPMEKLVKELSKKI